ncbi:MAG: hypothetical protein GY909_15810 [Oligoflexia bacterium]|nr:hypothetical protein [Oligoflexia bacterium]
MGRKKKTIEEMRELSKSKGGLCLSGEYCNSSSLLTWECDKGHRWDASYNSIYNGSWCPKCSGNRKGTIEDMQKLAKEKKGACLSTTYLGSRGHLIWKCEKGHEWMAPPKSIKRGTWCPECAGVKKKTIKDMHDLAKSKGGGCLSKEYINMLTKLEWQCKEGHRWEATPNSINNGSWCPKCSDKQRQVTIEDMQRLAKKKEGYCISKDYLGNEGHLEWQCKEGHRWEATPKNITQGTWCPTCNKSKKRTIEEMKVYAKKKGGKCLSKEYVNRKTKLMWECEEGHQWLSAPENVIKGHWCKICAYERKRKFLKENPPKIRRGVKVTLESVNKVARLRGGECLRIFKNESGDKRAFLKCNEGHTWDALVYNIKNGSWCPICNGAKNTIEQMKALAVSKKGLCLSDEYKNQYTKLKWKCEKGHEWMAQPRNIIHGRWCPTCYGRGKTIEDLRDLASSKGGVCLSNEYVNNKMKYEWVCKRGHIFKKVFKEAKSGWCKECNKIERDIKKSRKHSL